MIFKIMNLQSQNQIASLSLDCGASRNVPRKRDARVTQDAIRPKSRTRWSYKIHGRTMLDYTGIRPQREGPPCYP
jgi:hypothetical protein